MGEPGERFQDLGRFVVPPGFRGRSALTVQLWNLVQATLFAASPQVCYGWRRWLLRLFGADVGPGARVRPSARITYPWKVSLGARCWISDGTALYSLGEITIGADAVISQRSYLCTGSHDPERVDFPIFAAPIAIGPEAWIATDVFVGPGVTIGRGAVVGARSAVFSDLPEAMICYGAPARPLRPRRPSSTER
ncbi:MAG: WcaF family extracellular polysaccharide biosynthesis acetyltransferase [Rhodovibrionaceae bacterium]